VEKYEKGRTMGENGKTQGGAGQNDFIFVFTYSAK
jgi:hypothetical protein|tara:strand:+ start:431 stop:535 length:105 start_codon:yes stop_codon:yes gene_type:complete